MPKRYPLDSAARDRDRCMPARPVDSGGAPFVVMDDGPHDVGREPTEADRHAVRAPDLHRRNRPRSRRPRQMRGRDGAATTRSREHPRRGAYQAGEALEPTSTATTVRVGDGQTVTTDGPFAETKEALGGFYLVEAADLDEAIAYAAMIPGARHGCDRGPPGLRLVGDRGRAGRRVGHATDATAAATAAVDRPRPPTRSSTACSARSRAGRSRR